MAIFRSLQWNMAISFLILFICFVSFIFLRLHKDFALFYAIRFRVAFLHKQTFLRTDSHATSALNTVKPVDGPGSNLPVHRDGAGRTGTHTKAAGNAVFNLNAYMPPHPLRVFRRHKGVLGGGRFPKQILQHSSRQGKRSWFLHKTSPFTNCLLSLRAAYARVNGQNQHRHIRQLTSLQHLQQRRNIAGGRRPQTETI